MFHIFDARDAQEILKMSCGCNIDQLIATIHSMNQIEGDDDNCLNEKQNPHKKLFLHI